MAKNCLLFSNRFSIIIKLSARSATVAQSVEQLIRNQQVAGSSPASSSKNPVHVSGRDFYFLLFTSSLLLQIKFDTGFLGSNK